MKNYTHMLIETADEMQSSIENIDKVINEQAELVDVVEKSEKSKKFEEFTSSLKQQIEETIKQKNQLIAKRDLLEDVIEMCKDENVANAISTFCVVFGIFGLQLENNSEDTQHINETNNDLAEA